MMLSSLVWALSSSVVSSTAVAFDADLDEGALLQTRHHVSSKLGPKNFVTVSGECPFMHLKVTDFKTCNEYALSVSTEAAGQDKDLHKVGCVRDRGTGKVLWNPVPSDEWHVVCFEQMVKSESCFGKVCEVQTFPVEEVDKVLAIGTGVDVPETLRGLWMMDGNPMPDALLSMATKFVVEPNNMVVGKLYHASNAVALHDDGPGRSLFRFLEAAQPDYYEVRCKYEGHFNNVTFCTISPSLFGAPPIPSNPEVLQWTMELLPTTHEHHIQESDTKTEATTEQLTFLRRSLMFGQDHKYYFRRVVDQHGRRLPEGWNHFMNSMKEQGRTTLARIHNTGNPALFNPLRSRLQLVGQALLGMAFPEMLEKMSFSLDPMEAETGSEPASGLSTYWEYTKKRVDLSGWPPFGEPKQHSTEDPAAVTNTAVVEPAQADANRFSDQAAQIQAQMMRVVNTALDNYQDDLVADDRYETLTDIPGRCDQRSTAARLARAMELGISMGINAHREDPFMAGIGAVLDRLIRILTARIWRVAYEDGGKKPINPALDNFMLRDSPLPYPLSALLFTWDELIGVLNIFVATPLVMASFHANGNRTYYFTQWAQQHCYEMVPFAQGPMVFKYPKVVGDMEDPNQARGYYTSAALQNQQTFNLDGPLFLSSGSGQHTKFRQILEDVNFARAFPVPFDFMRTLAPAGSAIVNGSVDPVVVAMGVLPTILKTVWGEFPDAAHAAAIAGYIRPGSLGVFGDYANSLISGVRTTSGEPSLEEQILGHRKAALEWARNSTFYANLTSNKIFKEYIEEFPGLVAAQFNEELGYDTEQDHFVMNLMDGTLFAGYIGTHDLTTKCIQYQNDDPHMKDMFEENPEAFIIELMRYDSAVTSFTALYQEDTEEILDGQKITFKKGTPYQAALAGANRDPTVWDAPDEFNPKRLDLGNMIAWNGKLKDVEARNLTKAPRGCPGHCLSLKVGAALCASYMGSFSKLKDKGLIQEDIQCDNFNKDCVGDWVEGPCSSSCGMGFKTRTFHISKQAEGNGRQCKFVDGHQDTLACNLKLCETPCEKVGDECAVWTVHAALQATQPTSTLSAELFTRLAYDALVHKRGLPAIVKQQVPQLSGVPNPDNVPATLDPENLDKFIVMIMGAAMGSSRNVQTAVDIPVPQIKDEIPCFRSYIWCTPMGDIDSPEHLENATKSQDGWLTTLSTYLEPNRYAVGDDLDVPNRNRWDLIMHKPKYKSPEVTELLGHEFATKYDYMDQLWRWHKPERKLGSGVIDWQQIFHQDVGNSWRDELEHFIAFKQMGTHRVGIASEADIREYPGVKFKISTAKYEDIRVREGFAKIGSEMFFGSEGFPVLVKIGSQIIKKEDDDWQYAKFHWRSSLFLVITLEDHLLTTHMSAGGVLARASREVLPARHPLRRLLTRYTAGTIGINLLAAQTLLESRAWLARCTPFADFPAAVATAINTMPSANESMKMILERPAEPLLSESPFVTDGQDIYRMNSELVEKWFDEYAFCNDDGSYNDKDVEFLAKQMKTYSAPNFMEIQSEDCNKFMNDLKMLTFAVSGFHNHVGNVAGHFEDPDLMAFSWGEGEAFGRPKQAMLTVAMVHATSHASHPTLIKDFTHLCEGIDGSVEKCRKIFMQFQQMAIATASIVTARNDQRTLLGAPTPYRSMHPTYIENMVAK